ncbi:MAG: hypothetical protein JWM14_2329 [Chitinophagaceae bacterium]|nr:hypothetical protein [Chitinophagaceae bacterium]
MTDQEFDILDELYFVISFQDLMRNLSWSASDILPVLKQLVAKEMVKCIDPQSEEEVTLSVADLDKQYNKILFLATKKGLMEHNSREE